MNDLTELAELIRARNAIDTLIARRVGRPAHIGHVGEFLACAIFNIQLEESATARAIDGRFVDGPLAGRTVNVKWFTKHDGLLDINEDTSLDYYLVFKGPKTPPASSRGAIAPWVIEYVFLLDAQQLLENLRCRNVKIQRHGATGIASALWEQAEIYPVQRNITLMLTETQRAQLALFSLTIPKAGT
ncbi:MAG: hypothetical protein OJF49_000808 [Ktedonobacterales bacterium]|nr:MAG: hypothetical protein OJF49_000808 [Ktedonobacterales bacterium]